MRARMLRPRAGVIRRQPGGYLAGGLCSAAGVIVIGGGCGAGFFAFGFAAGSSPEAAAADAASLAPSLAPSLGAALDFGLVAGASPEDTAAVEDASSFSAVDLRFGFAAGVLDVVADAPSLSLGAAGLITAVFLFSGLESPDACAGAGGGLVPV